MTTIQLVVAVAGFVSLLAAIIGGAWLNLRSLERQVDAMRNEFVSFRNEMKAELRATEGRLMGEIGTLRAEMTATREKVDRIERQLDSMFKPIPPGRGD